MVASGNHRRTILTCAAACLVVAAAQPPLASAAPDISQMLPDGTPLPALRGEIPEKPAQTAAPGPGTDSTAPPPPPPDIAMPVAGKAPKKPLAWRARVPEATTSSADSGHSGSTLVLPGSSAYVLAAIGNACPAVGLAVESLNAEAGEVLVRSIAAPQHSSTGLIIAVRDRGSLKATVTIIPESKGGTLDLSSVDALLRETRLILNRRGSL